MQATKGKKINYIAQDSNFQIFGFRNTTCNFF